MSRPPNWIVGIVEMLLPPECREVVLGDLEERFHSARPTLAMWRYVFDAATVIPSAYRGHGLKWRLTAIPQCLPTSANSAVIRRGVEQYQHDVFCRNLFNFGASALLCGMFTLRMFFPDRFLHSTACVVGIAAALYAAYRYQRSGGARGVPSGLSLPALVRFHRSELVRQRSFFRNLWRHRVLAWIPFMLALHLDSWTVRQSLSLSALAFLVAMGWSALAARTFAAREFQRQIDDLDRTDWSAA